MGGALTSSLSCVCALQGNKLPDPLSVTRLWLSQQPLTHDTTESVVNTQLLCARIEARCPLVLGENGSNLGLVSSHATPRTPRLLSSPFPRHPRCSALKVAVLLFVNVPFVYSCSISSRV